MDTSAGRRASSHGPQCNRLSEKENVDFIKPDMWPPNNPDLNTVFMMPFSNKSITDENLTRWKN